MHYFLSSVSLLFRRRSLRRARRELTTLPFAAEVLEMRTLLSGGVSPQTPALPKLTLTQATTLDAKSVEVSYTVATANITHALQFQIYRSSTSAVNGSSQLLGTQTIPTSDTTDLALGTHTDVKMIVGTSLPPNQSLPYIVVVANSDNGVTEDPSSTNTAYFRTWELGAVAHGFNSGSSTTTPTWETRMAGELVTNDHYDQAIAFNWMSTAGTKKAGQATAAGDNLYKQLVAAADKLAAGHKGDVVDLSLIGHSRGAVVVSRAAQDLVGTTDRALMGSYVKMTLLDPHPAGTMTLNLYSANGLLSSIVVSTYQSEEKAMADPQVVIPKNVSAIDVYYQHSNSASFPSSSTESTIDFWGEGPSDGIINQSSAIIQWHSLTGFVDNTIGPDGKTKIGLIGHSEITDWYEMHIVKAGLA